jgi:SAM-dependent methyltransferase
MSKAARSPYEDNRPAEADYRLGLHPETSDDAFIEICYRRLLGREPDKAGRVTNLAALQQGASRLDVILGIARSAEYYTLLTKSMFGDLKLPRLQEIRPTNFETSPFISSDQKATIFRARNAADFDWLEKMILECGYYEKPGVWSLMVDQDKQVIAEIIRHFSAHRCLELGCATGPVLKLLAEAGIQSEGVEISHMALALAYPDIRKRIHFGDLLSLDLKGGYDVIIGMDVFEHLNPNKIAQYVNRCFKLLRRGGYLFTNIPAFGNDKVFGEVFPFYLEEWRAEAARNSPFSALHVDEAGWPFNGHLIWATSIWWRGVFEESGFVREAGVERALHEVYDPFYHASAPARKSFFVFSKEGKSSDTDQIVRSIRQKRSSIVGPFVRE